VQLRQLLKLRHVVILRRSWCSGRGFRRGWLGLRLLLLILLVVLRGLPPGDASGNGGGRTRDNRRTGGHA
jgi:hypothetical protein